MALRQDLFRGVTAFRHEPRHYCAYTNGKSFGVLGATGLRPKGPHRFSAAGRAAPATTDVAAGGDGGGGGGSSAGGGDSGGGSGSGGGSDGEDSMPSLSHDIQPHVGCILHFESSLFAMWQAKYCAMAMRHMWRTTARSIGSRVKLPLRSIERALRLRWQCCARQAQTTTTTMTTTTTALPFRPR